MTVMDADCEATRHATLMDTIYRRQTAIYDVTRRYYLVGRNHMIRDIAAASPRHVLEIGCGTGRNLVHVARQAPDAQLFGVDISQTMLAAARKALAGTGAKLAFGDAEKFDARSAFACDGFDAVFLSYSLSMIPGWRAALETALDQVAPGGSLHIADFSLMAGWPAPARRAMSAWLAAFHVEPRRNLEEAAFQTAEHHGMTFKATRFLRDYAICITIKRPGDRP